MLVYVVSLTHTHALPLNRSLSRTHTFYLSLMCLSKNLCVSMCLDLSLSLSVSFYASISLSLYIYSHIYMPPSLPPSLCSLSRLLTCPQAMPR